MQPPLQNHFITKILTTMWEAAWGHFTLFFLTSQPPHPNFASPSFIPWDAPVLRGGRASSCTAAAPFLRHTDKQGTC